jgi:hypothetical protein
VYKVFGVQGSSVYRDLRCTRIFGVQGSSVYKDLSRDEIAPLLPAIHAPAG